MAYVHPNGKAFSIAGIAFLGVFLYASLHLISKHQPWFYAYGIFCLIYLLNTSFSAFGAWFAKPLDLEAHAQVKVSAADYVPSVDVFLPNCGEPLEVLANQFKAVATLDYPNFKVYCLDDADRAEVKILADLHGFEYHCRPDRPTLKKAGNLRYGFAQSSGDLILVFDADFTPRSDFLKETVCYFQDESLGILQTPQYFEITEDQPAIQRGASYLQEVFYRVIQNFRNNWGASVCCGSNAIYRRAALEPYGGAAAVERSEDVNTGLSVLRAGWRVQYLPLNLAKGLSPETVKAFFHQNYRWCSGSMHLITSEPFWSHPNVSWLSKISYFLSILYYCTSGFGVLLFSLPSILNVWLLPDEVQLLNYLLIIPASLSLLLMRGLWAKSKWGLSVLITSMAAGFTHLVGLTDVVFGDVAPWVPTGAATQKSNKFDRFTTLVAIVPSLQFGLLLAGVLYRHIDWHAAIMPVCWLGFQMCLSWRILHESYNESGL